MGIIKLEYQVQIIKQFQKMKIVALIVTTAQAAVSSTAECWSCSEYSLEDCAANGQVEYCRPAGTNEEETEVFSSSMCMVEIRKREGTIEQVKMGCKDRDACATQKANNFLGGKNFKMNQCQPKNEAKDSVSVCRQCCSDENCNGGNKVNSFLVDADSSI